MSFKLSIIILNIFIFNSIYSQESNPKSESLANENSELRERIIKLEELQKESSLAVRGLYKDTFLNQKSSSYISLSFGLSSLSPDEVERDKASAIDSITGEATWGSFQKGYMLDLEIGKAMLIDQGFFLNLGIGYQHYQSEEIEGSIATSSGNYSFSEKMKASTLLIRSSLLREFMVNHFVGGGLGLGYTPSASINYTISKDSVGVVAKGEGSGVLFEPFLMYKLNLPKHFKIEFKAGYRFHKISNVDLFVADLLTQSSTLDLDLGGVYGAVGIGLLF